MGDARKHEEQTSTEVFDGWMDSLPKAGDAEREKAWLDEGGTKGENEKVWLDEGGTDESEDEEKVWRDEGGVIDD
jgi:hypothetical protein